MTTLFGGFQTLFYFNSSIALLRSQIVATTCTIIYLDMTALLVESSLHAR